MLAVEAFRELLESSRLAFSKRNIKDADELSLQTKKTTKATDDNWRFLTYLVFDAPSVKGGFEERYQWLKKNIVMEDESSYAAVVGHELCLGKDHLMAELKKVLDAGGEGMMLREVNKREEE